MGVPFWAAPPTFLGLLPHRSDGEMMSAPSGWNEDHIITVTMTVARHVALLAGAQVTSQASVPPVLVAGTAKALSRALSL